MPNQQDERTKEQGRLTQDELLTVVPRRSATREVKVGAFVLIGIIAFFVVLFTMTDVGTFRARYYTQALVPDAGGMRRGDPIQMRGVNIGRVQGFEMVPKGVLLRLEIHDRFPVPEDSRVEVGSSGLLGGMTVNVLPGNSSEIADEDDVLPGSVDAGVFTAAGGLAEQADTVLNRAGELLSRGTIESVGASATQLQTLLADLNAIAASQRAELNQISASLRRSAAGLENATAGPELARSVARVDSLTAQLDVTSANLRRASGSLEEVLARMERGEGTLGRLSTDDSLYVGLNTTIASINSLVEDIRANPTRYFNVRVF